MLTPRSARAPCRTAALARHKTQICSAFPKKALIKLPRRLFGGSIGANIVISPKSASFKRVGSRCDVNFFSVSPQPEKSYRIT
jgi:hypothetical protein